MRYIVGVSDMKIAFGADDEIVTHALGSCIGIAMHDPVKGCGGILHYLLPLSKIDIKKAQRTPYMFADTGIPLFLAKILNSGSKKKNIRVVLVGGARLFKSKSFFNIGKRNSGRLQPFTKSRAPG